MKMKKKKSNVSAKETVSVARKKKKICIATPMYGGQCFGAHAKSVLSLAFMLNNNGYEVQRIDLYNESLITRARDILTEVFLRGDATHLLWIDADVEFDPNGVLKMIEEDVDVIAAAIPLKGIDWKRIQNAAELGEKNLKNFSSTHSFNLIDKSVTSLDRSTKHEVWDAATGLMLIKREVFDSVKPLVKDYILNGNSVYSIKKGDRINSFWNTGFDEEHDIYLSEDYMFCKMFKSVGGKVWLAPYVAVAHYGTHAFI